MTDSLDPRQSSGKTQIQHIVCSVRIDRSAFTRGSRTMRLLSTTCDPTLHSSPGSCCPLPDRAVVLSNNECSVSPQDFPQNRRVGPKRMRILLLCHVRNVSHTVNLVSSSLLSAENAIMSRSLLDLLKEPFGPYLEEEALASSVPSTTLKNVVALECLLLEGDGRITGYV